MKEKKREKLNFIINNADRLKIEEKRNVLNLLMLDLGIDSIYECADGCRIIINKLSKETIEDILLIMAHLG
jgi:hypothetical protein